MAKAKRKKQAPSRNSQNLVQMALREMKEAEALSENKNSFKNKLLLQDDSELRSYLNSLPRPIARVMDAFLLKKFNVAPTGAKTNDGLSYIEYMAFRQPKFAQSCIISAVVGLLSAWLMNAASNHGTMEAFADQLELATMRLPEDLIVSDITSQDKSELDFTDPAAVVTNRWVNWGYIFAQKDPTDWAKRCVLLIDSIIDQKTKDEYCQTRNDLVLSLTKTLGTHTHLTSEKLKKDLSGIFSEFSEILMNQPYGSFSPLQSMGVSADIMQRNKTMIEESTAMIMLDELQGLVEIDDLIVKAFADASADAITYATLTLLANNKSVQHIPPILQSFACRMMEFSFSSRPHQLSFLTNAKSKRLHFNPRELKHLPEHLEKEARENMSQNNEPWSGSSAYTSIQQMLYKHSALIAATPFSISLRWEKTLISLGYSPKEAAVLCGYFEGANQAHLSEAFNTTWDNSVSELKELNKEQEQNSPQPDPEYLKRLEEADMIRSKAEILERRLRRENRTAEYRAEKAEQTLESTTEALEETKQELKRLQKEKEALQKTILELSTQLPDNQEQQEPEPKEKYPSDIGKDIRFVVYGGPPNWIAEQRRRFPYISFLSPDALPKSDLIANADILMLNVFVMSHKFFWPVQEVAKQYNIPLRYFAHKGINRGSEEILEAYQEYIREQNENNPRTAEP